MFNFSKLPSMNLYWDLCIIVDFYETSKILCARWLEVRVFRMSEFEDSFHLLMGLIEKYKVKKLLMLPSTTMINLPEEQLLSTISLLQSGLAHSQIEKLARVYVDKSERDQYCINTFRTLLNEMQLKIEYRSFEDKKSALIWLEK